MAGKIKKKLGEILIEDGLLEPAQLKEALAFQVDQGGLIGQVLIDMKFVEESHLVSALGKQFRIPYIPLKNYAVNPDVTNLLKSEFCLEHLLVAFDANAKKIWIAISDPLNSEAIEKVASLTQRIPQVFISRNSEIRETIFSLYHERV